MSDTDLPSQSPDRREASIQSVAAWLSRVRRTAKALLITERVAWIVGVSLALLLGAGLLDFFLRTPGWLRGVLLVIGLVALTAAVTRLVWPAFRFRPSLTEVALRIERSEQGRAAGLEGVLASGLELAAPLPEEGPRAAFSRTLARPVVAEAARRAATVRGAGFVSPRRAGRSAAWAAASVAAVLLAFFAEPGLSWIGARRLLTPWSDAQWPRRTGVVDAGTGKVHPLGAAFALQAAVTKSAGAPGSERVAARYRVLIDGRPGPARRVLLTSQDRTVQIPGVGEGALFERLIEPTALGAPEREAPARTELEYWFETSDDSTEPRRVLLVEPPEVLSGTAVVEAPAYAVSPGDPAGRRTLDLGPGNDDRAAPPPLLAGSRVRLRLELNKPVPTPESAPGDGEAWIRSTLGPDALSLLRGSTAGSGVAAPDASFAADGNAWTIEWTLADAARFVVRVTDEHGLTSPDEAVFRFDALRDAPPTAVVTRPQEDRAVLPTAVIDLGAEARDDVALAWLTLESQRARRPAGSEGAPVEAVEEPRPIGERVEPSAAQDPDDQGAGARRLVVTRGFDLSSLELSPGDEVWITALAADTFELDGARHEPVRSTVRRLRILSRDQFVEQVWSELGGVRRTAIRIDEDQHQVAQEAQRPGEETARRAQRAQAGVTERLARQGEALAGVRERLEENGLQDPALERLIDEARESLERAGRRSVEASQALDQAAQAQAQESAGPEAGRQERQQAGEAQEGVREELANLVDLLDQGEDTWASRRALEQILDQQRELRSRTGEVGQQTTGKPAERLTPQERQALDQLAREQEALSDKLRDAIDKMLEREQKMREADPAAAQAMAQAAQRGRREQAAERMRQAAQQAQQNQTNNAQQQQQQAIESLESMLNELDQTNANRDEVLRRYLASLIESIDGLIQQQTGALAELGRAHENGEYAGLDAGMARLHQNTLGVLDEANAGPREAAPVADLIGRAADAQAAAVVALRADPVDDPKAQQDEEESLRRLREAKETAERLDREAQERQQERKRAELRKQYEAALRQQIQIRDAARPMVGIDDNRRNRAAARLVAQEQEALRATLETLRSETRELQEAKVFDYAHTRLDALMRAASEALSAAVPDTAVIRRQESAVRVLQGLVEALDNRKRDQPFRENEQGGGEGGGGGSSDQPLVPPAAEVKLLRAMQQEAADLTRELGDAPAPDPQAVQEAGQLQRELAAQGKQLLEKLAQQAAGGEPEAADPAPGDEPEPNDQPPAQPEGDAL